MNILFLTIAWPDIGTYNLYSDLMDEFVKHGHTIYVACASEKRFSHGEFLEKRGEMEILHVKTGNLTATPFIEKGISNILIGHQFLSAIKKYWGNKQFDLLIMSTPPVTLANVFSRLKSMYNAKTYLLLKDIWPQGIADLQIIRKYGLIYKYFRYQEINLYKASDFIGCMSPANVQFLEKHNFLSNEIIVEVNPNSIKIRDYKKIDSTSVRLKYGMPLNKCIFIFGGNLGKPQGIERFLSILEQSNYSKNTFFTFVGNGTEADKVKLYSEKHSEDFMYIPKISGNEYRKLCSACDVGIILLDYRYTIPNFPSRLLSYLENHLPVFCYTGTHTDIGEIVEQKKCGINVPQNDSSSLGKMIDVLAENSALRREMGENSFQLLKREYSVNRSYNIIMSHFDSI